MLRPQDDPDFRCGDANFLIHTSREKDTDHVLVETR